MSYLRNHKLLLLIISVLLIANIALLYFFVFNKPHNHPQRPTEKEIHDLAIEKVKTEVGLDDQQAAVYDSLRTNQFKKMRPLFDELVKAKEEYFSLIYQQGVSDSVLNAYAARIGEKQMALDVNTFRYFQSIKGLCKEEQKPKMDSFIKQIVKRIINNGPRRSSQDKKEKKSS